VTTADVGGVSLYWEEAGAGEPLLFVHGIPTDYRAWKAQVAAFAPKFRVFTFSRRCAHPNVRAGDLRDSTIENNAEDLAGLIHQLGVAPVHLVGHSYGGFISAFLAHRRPELLRSLTLVEPAIASLLLKDPKSSGQRLGLLLRHPKVALSAQRYLKRANDPALAALQRGDITSAVRFNLDGVEDRSGVLEHLPADSQEMMLANGRTVAETGLPYPALGRQELQSIRTPTLVVHGETSAFWLRAVAEMTGRAIPGARVVTVPSSGHYAHLQNPEAFNRVLSDFLRQRPTS